MPQPSEEPLPPSSHPPPPSSRLLGPSSDPLRILLGSFSDPSRTLLGSFSDPSRTLLGPFSDPSRNLLGTFPLNLLGASPALLLPQRGRVRRAGGQPDHLPQDVPQQRGGWRGAAHLASRCGAAIGTQMQRRTGSSSTRSSPVAPPPSRPTAGSFDEPSPPCPLGTLSPRTSLATARAPARATARRSSQRWSASRSERFARRSRRRGSPEPSVSPAGTSRCRRTLCGSSRRGSTRTGHASGAARPLLPAGATLGPCARAC